MDGLFVSHFLNGFLMIAMPVGLAIVLTRVWKLSWKFWLVGAAVFILSQVGHIPFNSLMSSLLNKTGLVDWPKNAQTIFNFTFLGLSAGLFEEFSRYAMFRWWLKDGHTWRRAVLAGAGHGGAEAIILGAIVLLTFFQMSAYRNVDLTGLFPAGQLELAKQQVSAYWSLPWYLALLGALERLLTIPVHIAMSVLVVQSFIKEKFYWVWLAVLLHAFSDFIALFVAQNYGVYWAEAAIGGVTAICLIIIFLLRQPEPIQAIQVHPDLSPVPVDGYTKPVEETAENLDNSKFQ